MATTNFDLNAMGLASLSRQEMMDTDGGFLPLLILGAIVLLASGCVTEREALKSTSTGVDSSRLDSARRDTAR